MKRWTTEYKTLALIADSFTAILQDWLGKLVPKTNTARRVSI